MGAVVVENGVARRVDGWPSVARPLNLGGALLVAAQSRTPGFHQLTKNPGETVNIRWSVRNDGDANGQARLSLAVVTVGTVQQSPVMTIAPGQTVNLVLAWSVNLARGQQFSANVLIEIPNAANSAAAPHLFTITVPGAPAPPPPTGPELRAENDLQIT